MINLLLKSRYMALVISIFMFFNSVAFFIMGAIKAVEAYSDLIRFIQGDHQVKPGLVIAESLDTFLISIVTLIISLGIAKVFFLSEEEGGKLPKWLNIHSFKDLKILLWETILMTLVVLFLTLLISTDLVLNWQVLVLPISIMLLTIALVLMKGNIQAKK